MYVTAHGRVLPCCIAPFSMRGYDAFTLGDATQETLRDIWNGDAISGTPEQEIDFDIAEGLNGLRELVGLLANKNIGIRLLGRIGVTSHIGGCAATTLNSTLHCSEAIIDVSFYPKRPLSRFAFVSLRSFQSTREMRQTIGQQDTDSVAAWSWLEYSAGASWTRRATHN